MKKLICPKIMIGSSVAEHNFGLYSFFAFFIREAGRALFPTKFRCAPLFKRPLVVYKTFGPTPIDARSQYAAFAFAKITSIVFSYAVRLQFTTLPCFCIFIPCVSFPKSLLMTHLWAVIALGCHDAPIYSLPDFSDVLNSLKYNSTLFVHCPRPSDLDMIVSDSGLPVFIHNRAVVPCHKIPWI